MMRKLRVGGAVALGTTLAIFAAACGNAETDVVAIPEAPVAPVAPPAEGTPAEPVAPTEPVVAGQCEPGTNLTLMSFVNWDPAVISGFESEYGVTVTVNQFGQSTDLQDALMAGLAAGGAGVGDVVTVEGDQFSAAMIHPTDWVTLPEIPGRWLDWAEDEGRVADGSLKGYRTDIGPLSVIYNVRLLEEQGFGQYADPAAFGQWIGGANATWDTFLTAARQWHDETGIAFVDSVSNGPFRAALRQLPAAFEDPTTGLPLSMADNTQVHDLFMKFAQATADGLGAGTPFWNPDWGSVMMNDEFLVMVAPPWQIGWPLMSAGAGYVDGDWRIATAFPEGGGNWGGTFIGVPSHGSHIDCSIALADWLTNDETASTQWAAESAFPSQVAVLNAGLEDVPETAHFLGDQAYAELLTDLAERIPNATFRGPLFGAIQDEAMFNTLGTVEDGINTPDAAWLVAVQTANDITGH